VIEIRNVSWWLRWIPRPRPASSAFSFYLCSRPVRRQERFCERTELEVAVGVADRVAGRIRIDHSQTPCPCSLHSIHKPPPPPPAMTNSSTQQTTSLSRMYTFSFPLNPLSNLFQSSSPATRGSPNRNSLLMTRSPASIPSSPTSVSVPSPCASYQILTLLNF